MDHDAAARKTTATATINVQEFVPSSLAGFVYFDVNNNGVKDPGELPIVGVTMTLTAPGCPLHEVLADWVRRAVLGLAGVEQVDVTLTFDPPWTPARIAAPR